MTIKYEGKSLDQTKLVQYDSKSFIRVSDANEENYIDFEYFPKVLKDVEYDNYQIFILNNNYLVAEKDFFQVHDKDKNKRLGWIFTISNLESKEPDSIENEHLNNYKLAAYYLLLQAKSNIKPYPIENADTDHKLSDLYDKDSIFIVIYDPDREPFPIFNYLPSLSKYGYYIKNEYSNTVKNESKKTFCLDFRAEKEVKEVKIYVRLSNCGNENAKFIDELFSKHLKSSDHHLLRFHMLYQVIEFYLSSIFESDSQAIIDNYISNRSNINGFIEKIGGIKSERTRVNRLITYTRSLGNRRDSNLVNLQRDCDRFLRKYNRETKDSLGDLVYDVRNLIVHEYRSIDSLDIDLLQNIIDEIELLVTNVIENFDFNSQDTL